MNRETPAKTSDGLRILYVATKPAYPPHDGGRLLIWNTLTELASRGHRVTYIAPDLGEDTAGPQHHLESVCESVHLVPAQPTGLAWSAAAALLTRKPLSVLRHTHRNVQRVIVEQLDGQPFDVIHAEQIQAFYNLPLTGDCPPVVLRAQNVESQLWRMLAIRNPRAAWIARDEARRMAVCEAQAVRKAAATVALTHHDAETLAGGAGTSDRRISVVRPPFPTPLPSSDEPLGGDPPVVLSASGWLPNRDSLAWFLQDIWPSILRVNPDAHAHIFSADRGTAGPSVSCHSPPDDSTQLFRPGSVLVVPLRIASGIRMKILESWARGVPVVATPTAVRGLDDVGEDAFLLARDGAEFGDAIARLRESPELAQRLIDAGRNTLASEFQPRHSADRLEAAYLRAIAQVS